MKKIALGTSGAQVSTMCVGAGNFGSRDSETISSVLLDQYLAAGGKFIDTANVYGISNGNGGESETFLGKWMKTRQNRNILFLATKVGVEYPGTERGLRTRQIESECERSLQRLGVETIDLYYAHVDDRNTPLEETLEAFDRLVQSGKVRFIGASNYRPWRLEKARQISLAHGWASYCCIQQRYTYLRPAENASFDAQISTNVDLLDYCKREGVTLLAYSPLLTGAYTRSDREFGHQYETQETKIRLKILREVAFECKATPNQVILAWMMQSTPPIIPVFTASTPAQMEEDLGALEVRLNLDQISKLNA
jgi:aryl-alcohol dehydrogenase-like predicted oxidoreductase